MIHLKCLYYYPASRPHWVPIWDLSGKLGLNWAWAEVGVYFGSQLGPNWAYERNERDVVNSFGPSWTHLGLIGLS